jgi:hypothetical protein
MSLSFVDIMGWQTGMHACELRAWYQRKTWRTPLVSQLKSFGEDTIRDALLARATMIVDRVSFLLLRRTNHYRLNRIDSDPSDEVHYAT